MLSVQDVLAEAAAWLWVPDDAEVHRTADYWLIAFPPRLTEPTVAARIDSARPPAGLVDEVLEAARQMGRDDVVFRGLSEATRPAGLVDALVARGAELTETVAVLALDLRAPRADLDVSGDVEIRKVLDLETLREADLLGIAVFGGEPMTEEELAVESAELAADSHPVRFLAYRDGVAVGGAGYDVEAGALRLWGGACLREARHRGVYRALLDHRLREGEALSCRLALVRGRVETSAPILRRAGFVEYGVQRSYRLPVA